MAEKLFREQVLAAIARLAAPAAVQAEYLREMSTYPSADELALELSDLISSKGRLRTECSFSAEVLQLIEALDQKLNSFSAEQYASDWDVSALGRSDNWAEVRTIAQRVLGAIR
jgi:hypothetical protein